MDQQRVDMYLMSNNKYYPPENMMFIRERLLMMDEYRFNMLSSVDLKDPTTLLLISIFVGSLGIDRFMLGDTAMGVLKLLTAGCCGVLTIIDWINIQKMTKAQNFNKLMMLLQ